MENRVITVKGIGKVSAASDLLVIELNLEVIETEYDATMHVAAEKLEALREAIASAGHDGKLLKTTSFSINTRYERYQDKNNNYQEKFIGYACTHKLQLEFDLDMEMLGATLNAIAACDANPKLSIRFSVRDTRAISAMLLENAVEDAKWKAGILAKSGGVTLGAILRIDYNWSEHHFYSGTEMRILKYMAIEEAAPMTMDIEPEDINVSDTATIVWSIV